MIYKFTCIPYPDYRVLISRVDGTDKWAQFRAGGFETDDAETARALRAVPFVHEDSAIDIESVDVVVNRQGEEVQTKARGIRKARGQ